MATPPKRARWNAMRSRANARSASVSPFRRASTPNPPTKLGRKGKRNG